MRPLPEIALRRIADEAIAAALGDINCAAYDMPLEVGRASFGRLATFAGDRHGCVGYVDGVPVSCAATLPLDGQLYVAFVATDAGHRRQGHAEAMMRRSIEEAARATGLSRLVLHATDAGRPLYAQMGFRFTAGFTYYAEGAASH